MVLVPSSTYNPDNTKQPGVQPIAQPVVQTVVRVDTALRLTADGPQYEQRHGPHQFEDVEVLRRALQRPVPGRQVRTCSVQLGHTWTAGGETPTPAAAGDVTYLPPGERTRTSGQRARGDDDVIVGDRGAARGRRRASSARVTRSRGRLVRVLGRRAPYDAQSHARNDYNDIRHQLCVTQRAVRHLRKRKQTGFDRSV